ncbi:MAG TPA: D-alanyl-D-alanine carboxypeptidase/D-alanyl-D-alanine-endopeptidase [Acidimicrobiia bacterium]
MLATVLLVAAVACVVVALNAKPPGERSAQPAARAVTPLLSARRVPDVVRADVAGARLQSALAPVLQSAPSSCVAVDGPTGRLASVNADAPLAPASTEKLLTATAALATYGPDFRYRTTVVATTSPRNGTVDRLWLVGSGDPVLSTPAYQAQLASQALTRHDVTTPLAALADAVVGAGVRSVPGGILGDDHLFDASRTLPVWPPRYVADGEIGPLGALTVDDGNVPPNGAPAPDPALEAASQLRDLLVARGVSVGPAGHATAPARTVTVGAVSSPPLHDVIASMLTSSDNLTAELLARLLATTKAVPGTTPAGLDVATAKLRGLHLPTTGLTLVDGSGLSPDDRATCNLLLATLEHSSDARYRAVSDGLPVAAQTGTLAERLRGTVLAGRLAAKTGSLDGVTGLVGTLDVRAPLQFAFLANGSFAESTGVALRERLATTLATYPDAPPASALVPAPAAPAAATRR